MSTSRWIVSSALALHLSAMAFGAIPAPERIETRNSTRKPPSDPIATHVAPFLDRVVEQFAVVPRTLWEVARPAIRVSRVYLNALGLGQQWIMFSNPPLQDEYVRVRYYVASASSASAGARPSWIATELVFPVRPDDSVRGIAAYWEKQRDKAIFTALDRYIRRVDARARAQAPSPVEPPDDLVPVARFFARRFQQNRLTQDERIVRTEVWFGVARIPERGTLEPPGVRDARLAVLRSYYDGPIEDHVDIPDYRLPLTRERESNIIWFLEYSDNR